MSNIRKTWPIPIVILLLLLEHAIVTEFTKLDIAYCLFILFIILFLCFLIYKKGRIIFFNFSILILLLGIGEEFLQIKEKFQPKWLYRSYDSPGFLMHSDLLGLTFAKNFTDTAKAFWDTIPLYSAVYTTDENGFRKTPIVKTNENTKGLVFFGCSYTFGLGLNDDQVMANIVQKKVGDKYKVYNFSRNAYGAQHMLALIDHNVVNSIIKFQPKYFIYQLIFDHIRRAVNWGWNAQDPKYIINKNTGEAEFAGNFHETQTCETLKKIKDSKLAGLFKKKPKRLQRYFSQEIYQSSCYQN